MVDDRIFKGQTIDDYKTNDGTEIGVTQTLNSRFNKIYKFSTEGTITNDVLDEGKFIWKLPPVSTSYERDINELPVLVTSKFQDKSIQNDKIDSISGDKFALKTIESGKLKQDFFHEQGDISTTWLDQRFVKIYNTIATQFDSSTYEFNQNALVFCYKE